MVSATPVTGSSRTPKCQSSPLDEAETLTAGTVSVNGLEPVECQKATDPPLKSYLIDKHAEMGRKLEECIRSHMRHCAKLQQPK